MNYRMLRGITLVELLVLIVIIAAIAIITAPMVIRERKKADQNRTVGNARQIGFSMFGFQTAYGSFPQDSHAETINKQTGNKFALSKIASSNDAFKQPLAAGIAGSEVIFFCKTAMILALLSQHGR